MIEDVELAAAIASGRAIVKELSGDSELPPGPLRGIKLVSSGGERNCEFRHLRIGKSYGKWSTFDRYAQQGGAVRAIVMALAQVDPVAREDECRPSRQAGDGSKHPHRDGQRIVRGQDEAVGVAGIDGGDGNLPVPGGNLGRPAGHSSDHSGTPSKGCDHDA